MLTVIVIAKNEELVIRECLNSVRFANELILVDSGSSDRTVEIAKRFGAKIIRTTGNDYSAFRNDGIKEATGDWILFVDSDERVSVDLKYQILHVTSSKNSHFSAFTLNRKNFYLNKYMRFGGWSDEQIPRLFKKTKLKGYRGSLHETPIYEGNLGSLTGPLNHFSHRDLSSMLNKTLYFTSFEAQNRLNAAHPRVVTWRLIRVIFTEFWFRFVKKQAFRDGVVGVIDGMFQVYNSFIIYARLWELQKK